jgi:hypothetical protein
MILQHSLAFHGCWRREKQCEERADSAKQKTLVKAPALIGNSELCSVKVGALAVLNWRFTAVRV